MPENKIKSEAAFAVIGGTGLDQIEGMTELNQIEVETPFGKPSDVITIGKLAGVNVAFLPRHGRGHFISPTELNSRANIYALKSLGVKRIIAVCSCGSFKEDLAPGQLLIPDQLIDRTRNRVNTYFNEGIVAHVSFAHPFCPDLSETLIKSAEAAGINIHRGGTYVCMEGPAFSTRAESRLYKSWEADVIGMTALPEAKLAREAEICYAMIACVTDYDSWWEPVAPVTVEVVLRTLRENIDTARKIIKIAVESARTTPDCECGSALASAIVTDHRMISPVQRQKLGLLIQKYVH